MSVTARKGPGPATLEDLLAIGDDVRRHELIEGELVEKEAASGKHGGTLIRIARTLGPFDRRTRPTGPSGWIFASDVDVYFDPHNTLRPDVVGWRRERLDELPGVVPVRVVPDWTCEVLSTNKRNDLVKKKRVYHRLRVGHYWIADPSDETLAVYRWAEEGYLEVLTAERGERVRAEPFDALELDIGVLFGDDSGE